MFLSHDILNKPKLLFEQNLMQDKFSNALPNLYLKRLVISKHDKEMDDLEETQL